MIELSRSPIIEASPKNKWSNFLVRRGSFVGRGPFQPIEMLFGFSKVRRERKFGAFPLLGVASEISPR